MKILSVGVPCYNSAEYMKHCIDTLLSGGELIEIIIVNDGSVDNTASIADEYASKYPSIIKVIHQENGGHGEAVNAGLRNATGVFYKVVDSDDWVDKKSLSKVLELLNSMVLSSTPLDLLVCNYVYEKQGAKRKKVINYKHALPENTLFTWSDVKNFKLGQYILMHSVIYRTALLRECNLVLPKHTFYVDNLFVYQPLPYAKNIYYLNVNLYRYFIGRSDQSVNEQVMIKRVDQQLLVNKLMIDSCNIFEIENKKLSSYMIKYISIITTVSSIMLIKSGEKENLEKKDELWTYLKNSNIKLYKQLKYNVLGIGINLPTKAGRQIAILIYRISRLIFKFN